MTNTKSFTIRPRENESINSHTPVFDFELYEISVSESQEVNSKVARIVAADSDRQDKIAYSIIGGDSEHIGIFPQGDLYLKRNLDREEMAFRAVQVRATDKGQRSSTAKVVIHVTDENDNSPEFERNDYVFEVFENEEEGSVLGRVAAYDRDAGRNAELRYFFAEENSAVSYFSIDEKSGFLSTKSPIDREEISKNFGQDFFQLDVTVSDDGAKPRSSTASITIVILDRNDNEPKFTQPFYQFEISEAEKSGFDLVKVHAKDPDKGQNGEIRYQLMDNDVFGINSESGQITLNRQLDRETVSHLSLTFWYGPPWWVHVWCSD